MSRTRVCLIGATGRLGREILRELNQEDFELVGAIASRNNSNLGMKLEAFGLANSDVRLVSPDSLNEAVKRADVVISTSNPAAEVENLPKVAGVGKRIVVGTTGFTTDQYLAIKGAVDGKVPTIISSNFAIAMNFLYKVAELTSSLPPQYQASIVESHHAGKLDSPSGTAYALGEILSRAMGYSTIIHDRHSAGKRKKDELEIFSRRVGGVPGIHEVTIAGPHDMIRIEHIAFTRAAFAQGALLAAKWLSRISSPQIYSMGDVLSHPSN